MYIYTCNSILYVHIYIYIYIHNKPQGACEDTADFCFGVEINSACSNIVYYTKLLYYYIVVLYRTIPYTIL